MISVKLALPNGTIALAAVYNNDGKMLQVETVTIMDGKAQIVVSDSVYTEMRKTKLMILQNGTYAPVSEAIERGK